MFFDYDIQFVIINAKSEIFIDFSDKQNQNDEENLIKYYEIFMQIFNDVFLDY